MFHNDRIALSITNRLFMADFNTNWSTVNSRRLHYYPLKIFTGSV